MEDKIYRFCLEYFGLLPNVVTWIACCWIVVVCAAGLLWRFSVVRAVMKFLCWLVAVTFAAAGYYVWSVQAAVGWPRLDELTRKPLSTLSLNDLAGVIGATLNLPIFVLVGYGVGKLIGSSVLSTFKDPRQTHGKSQECRRALPQKTAGDLDVSTGASGPKSNPKEV